MDDKNTKQIDAKGIGTSLVVLSELVFFLGVVLRN